MEQGNKPITNQCKEPKRKDNDEWTEYLQKVTMLADYYANAYTRNNQRQQHWNNTDDLMRRENMTKSKHFLQLIQWQKQQLKSKQTKQSLIRQITYNLNQCLKIDNKMQYLLREMSITMAKWQKIRRQQISRLKLHQLIPTTINQQQQPIIKSQINQQTLSYLRRINNERQLNNDQQQEVKMEHFNITNQNNHQYYSTLQDYLEREDQQQLYEKNNNHKNKKNNNNNNKNSNKNKNINDYGDIQI